MKKGLSILLMLMLVFCSLPSAFAQGSVSSGSGSSYYSILFNGNSIPNDFNDQLTKLGGKLVYSVPEIGFAQIQGSTDVLSQIKGLASVSSANPSVSWTISKTEKIALQESQVDTGKASKWNLQWDIRRITNDGESYKLGTGSHNVVVGIVDTGIDRDHPDLAGNLLPGSENFVPAGGFRGTEPEETGNPEAFDDRNGHGSHVAGSIAGNGQILGVAPDTGIRSYRVFGTSSAESAWVFKAMIAAANDGVDVVSMSLGGYDILGEVYYTDPVTGEKIKLGNDVADFRAYKRAVQYVTDKGALVVAAAGNDAVNAANKNEVTKFLNEQYAADGLTFVGAGIEVPGSIGGVVTVSATGPNDEFAPYSNYGEGFIDLAAVGGSDKLYRQYESEGRLDEYLSNKLYYQEFCLSASENGGYFFSIGTSMATPKVSAVAALLIDKYGKMSPVQLRNMLDRKAVDPVKDKDSAFFGEGNLDAFDALSQ